MPPAVPTLAAAARDVLGVLDRAGIPACLIGGLVVPRWGQPRATTDADVSALAPYGDELPVLDALLAHFEPRVDDARAFALDRRVLLVRSNEGVKIDVALAAFPFEQDAIARATPFELVPGVVVKTVRRRISSFISWWPGGLRISWMWMGSSAARVRSWTST